MSVSVVAGVVQCSDTYCSVVNCGSTLLGWGSYSLRGHLWRGTQSHSGGGEVSFSPSEPLLVTRSWIGLQDSILAKGEERNSANFSSIAGGGGRPREEVITKARSQVHTPRFTQGISLSLKMRSSILTKGC